MVQLTGAVLRDSEVAYRHLRDLIVNLHLEPGSMVDEQSLAARIGLGRMPVREAIARLGSDQLVVIIPRRGAMISPIGLDTIRGIFDAREVVESGIAYFAAQYATDAELEQFSCLVHQADRERDAYRPMQFLDSDQEVHRFLASIVHNSFLETAADRLLVHNLRFWRYYFTMYPPSSNTMITHQNLLEALQRREPAQARQAMLDHIHAGGALLHALFT